jgi:DNA polymerase-3 subunit gamma/tau
LQFNLKRLLPEQISKQMTFILQQEQIEFAPEALSLLSRAADGSMRDGLSLLDQAIAFGQGRVNRVDVSAMLGTVAQQPVDDLLRALASHDGQGILATIAEIAELTPDFGDILQQMLRVLHRVALLQVLPDYKDPEFDAALLAEFAARIPAEDVQLYYQMGLMGQKDFDLAPDPRTGFEMLMLRMLTFRPISRTDNHSEQPAKTASVPQPTALMSQPTFAPPANISPAQTTPAQPVYQPPVAAPVVPSVGSEWSQMIAAMNLIGPTKEFANHCALEHLDNSQCVLIIDPGFLVTTNIKERVQRALQTYVGNPALKLTLKSQKTTQVTPAMQQQQQRDDRQQSAENAINADPNVIALKEHFNARIEPGSIKPL